MPAGRPAGDLSDSGYRSSRGNNGQRPPRLPPTAPCRAAGSALPRLGGSPRHRGHRNVAPGGGGTAADFATPRRSARSGRKVWGLFLHLLLSFPPCFQAAGLCHPVHRPEMPGTLGAQGPSPRRLPFSGTHWGGKGPSARPALRCAAPHRTRAAPTPSQGGRPAYLTGAGGPRSRRGARRGRRRPGRAPPPAPSFRGAQAARNGRAAGLSLPERLARRRLAGTASSRRIGPRRGASLVARRRAASSLRGGVGRGRPWAVAGCAGSGLRGRVGPGCAGGAR